MKQNKFKLDQETIIKHRFWFLLGLLVPLVLVILILNWTSIAKATTKKQDEKNNLVKALQSISPTPPNPSWVASMEPRERKVKKKKKEIWEHAWNSQESLFVFPPKLSELKTARFGTPMDYSTLDKFQNGADILNDELEKISKVIDPVDKDGNGSVQYRGDWKTVLGLEPTWTERPKSAEIWLALEDLWVKGGLLDTVKQCNDEVGTYHDKDREAITALEGQLKAKQAELDAATKKTSAPDAQTKLGAEKFQQLKDSIKPLQDEIKKLTAQLKPLQARRQPGKDEVDRASFSNRTWQLDLVLANAKDGTLILKGQITNISSRRQMLGLTFNVSLRGNEEPVVLRPDGEPLGPREFMPIKPVTGIRRGDAITSVRQVFNWLTVPVKRVDRIVLASPEALSSRIATNTKLAPYTNPLATAFQGEKKDTSGNPAGGANPGGSAGQPDAGSFRNMMDQAMSQRKKMGGTISGPGGAGMGGGKGPPQGGLSIDRYIDQGEAVRRLPVALVVVIDQAYLQDFLTAIANSKLRIQITQVEWTHFPRNESIEPEHQDEDSGPGPNPAKSANGGRGGGKTMPNMPSMGPPGMGNPGNPGMGNPGNPAMRSSQAPQESGGSDELSANLLQVAVYGIASIYEHYTPSTEK
ncbi:MAG TPA: hypothetical protein VFA18_22645 [Gemmataceae bacterium]|nr:hypothetical protein [Gemmataceae bacterium]